jgi:RNA polymerase sigma-70 factor (ECF subfamily)
LSGNLLYNEKELLLRVSQGDEQAFRQLVIRYSQKVFFHTFNFVKTWQSAEEITQDIFLRLWQKRDKLANVENWDKYLFVVCKHILLNSIHKKNAPYKTIGIDDTFPWWNNPAGQYENKELGLLLQKAIDHLPEQKKIVFKMIHKDGLSQDEVSRELGIATRTVRWNLVSAMNVIKDYLYRHNAGELFCLFWLLSR